MTSSNGSSGAKCGAKTRGGGKCKRPAGEGTDHLGYGSCRLHAGLLPGPRKAAAKEIAYDELRFMGYEIEIEPTEAMLLCVRLAAGQLEYFNRMVEKVEPDHALDSRGDLNAWGRLQQEGIERLARVSKAAIVAGVAERRVRLAEAFGARIAKALESALAGIDLPAAQRGRVVSEFEVGLRLLEAGADDPSEPDEEAA